MLTPDPKISGRLETIPWFVNCGTVHPVGIGGPIQWVDTWEQARALYAEQAWEDITLAASNSLRLFLHQKYLNAYSEWRRIREESQRILLRSVIPAAHDFAARNSLGQRFVDCVEWDIGMALQESAYSKLRPPRFFTTVLLPVYEAGHFPCGWAGAWPDGQLVAI
jgi:hypothetical protein